jgi:malic enzyme
LCMQPTVGEACEQYHRLPLHPRGLYLSAADAGGGVLRKLRCWRGPGSSSVADAPVAEAPAGAGEPREQQLVVMTDGERVLGLGDLGANGMGIAESKIELYTLVAGVDPARCLPICLDVGTGNERLREDPAYRGLRYGCTCRGRCGYCASHKLMIKQAGLAQTLPGALGVHAARVTWQHVQSSSAPRTGLALGVCRAPHEGP